MLDSTSKQKRKHRKASKGENFQQILEEKTEELREENGMEGKTVGYGKNGLAHIGQAVQKTYN